MYNTVMCRTAQRPSRTVLQHIVTVARATAQAMIHLLQSGSSLHPQQLNRHVNSSGRAAVQLSSAGVLVSSCGGVNELHYRHAWKELIETPLHDFDAFIVLRPEAVPFGDRMLPHMKHKLNKMIQSIRHHAVTASNSVSSHGTRKRHHSEVDSLEVEPPPKQSRAILKAFPQQVWHVPCCLPAAAC